MLLYHVLGSTEISSELLDGITLTTLQGQDVNISVNNGDIYVNNALITVQDLMATNGVVHVIDAVLLPDMPSNSIYAYISASADHSTLLAAIDAAGLGETLSGGSYTMFAPTNAAFDALPAGTLDALLADPNGFLTEILFYHVLNGVVMSGDLSNGMMVATLQGQEITVTISNGDVFINDAMVTMADIMVDNGVIHVIDAVLIPEQVTSNTVFDIIQNSADHNTLETAIVAAGLDADLSTAGPFTVFAPTDAAFDALPAGVLDALLADPAGELTNILLYHVVDGTVLSGDLQEGMVMTLNGLSVTISFSGSDIFVNNAMVTIADLTADNGVVHVIDAVLIPTEPNPATVADIIINSEDHTTLEAALDAASLLDDLMADGPFTVFAPTDAAFNALPAGVLDALLADPNGELTDILLYHVVGETYMSTDLSDGQVLATLSTPYNLEISIDAGNVIINNSAMVTVADLVADNGVVHVIDAVLLLPSSVDEVTELGLEIYPNPAENMLNINLKNSSSKVTYQIIDMTGGLIEQSNLTAVSNQINVDNLAAGIYTIRVIDGNNVSVSNFIKK
ncbi:MAG: fasciclin domain-containing protein [Flavobacteriales bacterium]